MTTLTGSALIGGVLYEAAAALTLPGMVESCRWGVCTLDYEASAAQVSLRSLRLYCGPGERLTKHTASVRARAGEGVLCVVSLKSNGINWAQARADAQAVGVPVVIAVNHEPISDMTPAEWVTSQHALADALTGIPGVTTAAIMNGFAYSSTRSSRRKFDDTGGADAWFPQSMVDRIDVLAADFYDGGKYPDPAEGPGQRMRNFRTFCQSRGVTRMGGGEVGTFYLPSMVDGMQESRDFEWCCWWDHAEHHMGLTGDFRDTFIQYA